MQVPRLLRLLILPMVLLLALTACSSEEGDEESQDPDEIMDQIAETFNETESARFLLEIDGTIAIDEAGAIQLGDVEGAIERPASAQAEAGVQFAGSSVTMEIVAVDGDMYMRNILTGDWENAPSDLQYDPARIFNEEDGVPKILDELENVEVEGEESVNDVDAWHVTADLDTAVVGNLTGDFFQSETLDVELWAAQDDYRLLRVKLHDPEADDVSTWNLTLSEHDEPVDISAPNEQ